VGVGLVIAHAGHALLPHLGLFLAIGVGQPFAELRLDGLLAHLSLKRRLVDDGILKQLLPHAGADAVGQHGELGQLDVDVDRGGDAAGRCLRHVVIIARNRPSGLAGGVLLCCGTGRENGVSRYNWG